MKTTNRNSSLQYSDTYGNLKEMVDSGFIREADQQRMENIVGGLGAPSKIKLLQKKLRAETNEAENKFQDAYFKAYQTASDNTKEAYQRVIDISPPEANDQDHVIEKDPVNISPPESADQDHINKGTSNSIKNLLSFISKGEGGYDSSNRGTVKNKIVGADINTTRDNKKLSSMTLGEIKKYQAIKDFKNPNKLFAVGNMQFNPDTFKMTVKGLGLSDDTIFNADTQDKMGMWLITDKRPLLGRYLAGNSGVTLKKAHMELAKEFASIPVPYGKNKGNSYYGEGNKSQFSVQEVQDLLLSIRVSKGNN
jgi:hypothetical protein|tara:strand:- start:5017 stop:5940 length:924 start_codon:yes stop_codon:yes gene_type:complete